MLNDREKQILLHIINSFLEKGEPVGSRTLEKETSIGLSSATIRNVMSDLENLGMLNKTHHSSGREPTHLAFRFYLDQIIKSISNSKEHALNYLTQDVGSYVDLVERAKVLLENLTDFATITYIPDNHSHLIKNIFLNKIYDDKFLFGIEDQNSNMFTQIVNIIFSDYELELFNRLIKDKFLNQSIEYFLKNINIFLEQYNLDRLMNLDEILIKLKKNELIRNINVDGISKLLSHPDINNISKLKSIMELMDDFTVLNEYITSQSDDGLNYFLSNEDLLKDLTIISTKYNFDGDKEIFVGVLAPIRIDYVSTFKIMKDIDDSFKSFFKSK